MKKLLLSIFLTVFAAYICCGQAAFEKLFKPGNVNSAFENTYDVIKAPDDSGYYTLSTGSSPDSGALLSLVGNDGILKWSKSYQRVSAYYTTAGLSVLPLSDSTLMLNLYDVGTTILLKTSYAGTMLSAKRHNSIYSTTLCQKEKNNAIYGVGRISASGVNGGLFYKMDLKGNIIWSRMMSGGTSRKIVLSTITPTSDNGFLLAGTYSTISPSLIVLIRTDSIGNIIWQRQLNYLTGSMYPSDVAEAYDGGFMFAISTSVNGPSHFLKTDSIGNALWNVGFRYSSSFNSLCFDQITPGAGNTFITAGCLGVIDPSVNAAAIIDSAGNLLALHQYNNYSSSLTLSHYYHPQTGLVMFGYGGGFNNFGYYFCKTDSALTAPCISTPPAFTTYSYVVTDSATSIVSQPVSLSTSDVTAQMSVSSVSLTDSSLCPKVTSVPSIHNQDILQVSNADVSLFPNPFSNQLTFSLADNEQTTVSLYDFLRQQVLKLSFTNSTTINTEQLAAGIYFYELRNSKETLKIGKVVKQ